MLLDGWLALLYLVAFGGICYLWRPTPHNRRLAMSEELAQEDEDAEDYDMEALERRTRLRDGDDDDDATLVEDVNELSELWHFKTKPAWPVVYVNDVR